MNREFVQLSNILKVDETAYWSLGGWFVSEKLDGMRALWLPDTRGIRVGDIPFANLDKDRTGNANRLASGLWSRYASPIWAPTQWLNFLPKDFPLDGELFLGRNKFQETISIVRSHAADHEQWKNVKYLVFDSPHYSEIYRDGKIHNGQLKKNLLGIFDWAKKTLPFDYKSQAKLNFEQVYYWLSAKLMLHTDGPLQIHKQSKLSWRHVDAVIDIGIELSKVLELGGEGLIVRAPHIYWEPIRSKNVLKVKPTNEAEATIIGYNDGEGKYVGMIGSIIVKGILNGREIEFSLSGFSDELRSREHTPLTVGTVVTYLYREITTDGLPREARFSRIRTDL